MMPLDPGLEQSTIVTPVGALAVIASSWGVRAVLWPGQSRGGFQARCSPAQAIPPAPLPIVAEPAAILAAAAEQLREYFAGERRAFDLPLDPHGTAFQRAAWGVLRGIPFATTISYGEQACRLGDPRKARAVGAANGRNPIPIIIPCHRVIGADGSLTGFAAGVDHKAWLLGHEARFVRDMTPPDQSTGSMSPSTQERSK
jgi:methylated-DNA-[protein]-cysteine S-methyltransferase